MTKHSELVDIKQSVTMTRRQLCAMAAYFDMPLQQPADEKEMDQHITIAIGTLPKSVDEQGKEYAPEDALFAFGLEDELSNYGIVAL